MRLPMFAIHHNALAYSMTTLGSCMMTSIFSFYYVKLFLNKYQISEGAFHQAQVLYMIWNAVNDPLFGYIQDNSRVRCCARRRLSILYGAPFYALAFLLPWFPWKTYEAGDALSGLHLIVSLFAYDGMLTFVLLAQCALFAEISGQHENRLTLIKYSQIASLVGSCSVLFCGLVSDNMENFPYFQGFTIAVAFLACACMLYTGMYTISQYDKEDWKGSGEREQKAEVAGMSLTAVFSMTRQIVTQKDFLCFVSMNFCQVFLVAFYSNFAMIFTEHLIPQGALPSSVKSILYGAGFICPQLLVLSSQNLLRRLGYYRIILCTFYLEALASALVFLLGRQHYNILALYLIGSMVLVQATFSLFNLPLADIIDTDLQKHQRSKKESWNPLEALRYLMVRNRTLNVERITSILRNYQMDLISEPKQLLSELMTLDNQQFLTAMRLLLCGRKEQTALIDIDFDLIKEALMQSPSGNRSLFITVRERCLPALNTADCVELMGAVMRLSSGEFVQKDLLGEFPRDMPEDTFRNITAIFKDLYDKLSVSTQRAVYDWITAGLQKSSKLTEVSSSWVTAENLWFLGRYVVHLPVKEIHKISLGEIRMFINYDNATKQLDSMYDIKHGTARAFLKRINGSGFDMSNTSIVYRLGLLVCFYDNVQQLRPADARNLLHQLIKCNQLRGSQSDVQKLKSQLLEIVMKNQTLNESLGSVSDAVVGLAPGQLEALSPQAVQASIGVLQQVSGWTRSQILILAHKFIGEHKLLSFTNISQLGPLISGIDANLFYSISAEDLGRALEGTLSQYASELNPAQQLAVVSQVLTSANTTSAMRQIPSVLFTEVSLSALLQVQDVEPSALEEKQLRRSQAVFLYDALSKSVPPVDLLSTGQLVKGISCEQIQTMDSKTFLYNFSLFERNFHLLSAFQMNCLAWKYWRELNVTNAFIPPLLLPLLPTEYVDNVPTSLCQSFLVSLGRTDLDLIIIQEAKREAVVKKVLQCLNGRIQDEYDVDALGRLLCSLPPSTLRRGISQQAVPAALAQLKTCCCLSPEQKAAVKSILEELHGSPSGWTAELIPDLGPLITILHKDELIAIASKVETQNCITSSGSVPEEFLSALFEVVRGSSVPDVTAPEEKTGCHAVTAPSVDDIRKLSDANLYWSEAELGCISSDTFSRTVEVLGSVRRYNKSQLYSLKEKAKQAWGPVSEWRNYHVLSLGAIALALTESEIKSLNLSSIDSMTVLSQQEGWTQNQMAVLLHEFLHDSGLSFSSLKGSDLAGLGVILCGVDPKQVHFINPAAYREVYNNRNMFCSPILEGPPIHFGITVFVSKAGMTKEELSAVLKELMPYFQPLAIAIIPPENFREFSTEQLLALGPENAAAVTAEQREHLSQQQLLSLQGALNGLRDNDASLLDTVSTGTLLCRDVWMKEEPGEWHFISLGAWLILDPWGTALPGHQEVLTDQGWFMPGVLLGARAALPPHWGVLQEVLCQASGAHPGQDKRGRLTPIGEPESGGRRTELVRQEWRRPREPRTANCK
ncbi:OTOAN protein, partial [Polypterus senegalus]